jgi:predicted ATPase
MQLALARHDVLAEVVLREHAGTLVKSRGEGDSLFGVFARATDAVAAACALQQALCREPWPETPLRVRIALHTGDATERQGDYLGVAVNRCARLRAIAHGGQILLAGATHELVQDSLPSGASLHDLGTHRLRDLQRPERIFQLLHPDLPADFPPLASLDALPNNLPLQVTSFIGREQEIAEVKRLLENTRLLTVTGAGGTGKTRLALQVAAELLPTYADGVWLVELAPLAAPHSGGYSALVPDTVAAVLGVREQSGAPISKTLVAALKPKSLLLVLDNCEHLLGACATLAEALLRSCPGVRLLTTSREGLNIPGEMPYRLRSLSAPDPQHLPPSPERLIEYEAVRLFVDRATTVASTFTVTPQNAAAVAQVCHRLDGIPLAIELAAARVRVLPVEKIYERLDDRFRLLTGGSRTALPRQQTLRALIDWSYDLLDEAARRLLRRLAVFAGGWTLEAAEAVCAGDGIEAWEVLDLLSRLADKSLVTTEERDEEIRYRLLETIRQYARERLGEGVEETAIRDRHLSFFLGLAERAESEVRGPGQAGWLDGLEQEHDNLRAALEWALETEPEAALRLAVALGPFWAPRGYWSEGREALERGLARARRATDEPEVQVAAKRGSAGFVPRNGEEPVLEAVAAELRSKALVWAGRLAEFQGEYELARQFAEKCLHLSRALGDQQGVAGALTTLGNVAVDQGDTHAALCFLEESLAISRTLGDKRGIARSLLNLGRIPWRQGEYGAACALWQESLAMQRELGDKPTIAILLNNLGLTAIYQKEYTVARSLLKESLAVCREIGFKRILGSALNNLGKVDLHQGNWGAAQALFRESLAMKRDFGDRDGSAWSLEGLAGVAAAQEQADRAARLFGAAEAVREAIGAPAPVPERVDYEGSKAAVRDALGEEAFAAAWAAGRTQTWEQAIEEALGGQ